MIQQEIQIVLHVLMDIIKQKIQIQTVFWNLKFQLIIIDILEIIYIISAIIYAPNALGY